MSSTTVFAVDGMSCGHCEQSVSTLLSALPGVTAVSASAPERRVRVSSAAELDDEVVRAAVAEAGYDFAGRI